MKFRDIIKRNNWLSVEMVLLKLYPDEKKNISGYEEVLSKLKMLEPKEKDISILVSWEKDDFDQTDYVNVSGYHNNPKENTDEANISLALEFTPWNEWLGMDIDANTLKTFNELEIIAHCLYEVTFVGFEEEEIKAELDKINDAAEEIENMTEEERRENLKSWDEIKKEWEDEENDKEDDKE
jgi:hypothetical protein